ncbi:HYC_CC_PP family protein [Flavihumibacter solisilvae]|uniref:HYC_CC_PP family protein n=1 Tax=Flavihumibacter solisilvae TaxID=1349421 RepID=UPI00068BAD22|nr:hypothetical protein [Flavihumibacter solisilvae]
MKKFIVAILAILYLGSITGAPVHLHYCMGKIADWSLGHAEKSGECSNCGMEKSTSSDNGCCKDEHKFIKGSIDQKLVESVQLMLVTAVPVNPIYVVLQAPATSNEVEILPHSNAPPRSSKVDIYILDNTFLI